MCVCDCMYIYKLKLRDGWFYLFFLSMIILLYTLYDTIVVITILSAAAGSVVFVFQLKYLVFI